MRFPAKEVFIGDIPLGGNNPVRVQSMTNTDTADVKATIDQCIRIFDAGADYVRISVPSLKNVAHLEKIKEGLRKSGYSGPLIADVHFNPKIALQVAPIVEKVRINPGNYTEKTPKGKLNWTETENIIELEKLENNLLPLIKVCKENNTAIRVGTNFGSLSQRIISQFGNTPKAMVVATMEFLRIFKKHDFDKVVVSLKASNPLVNVQAYMLMAQSMIDEMMYYSFHVGVTEAGHGEYGRIKSALGIGTLLKEGVGDTIRVSLSEAPENEIPFALKLARRSDSLACDNSSGFIPGKIQILHNDFALPSGNKVLLINSYNQKRDKEKAVNIDNILADLLWVESFDLNKSEKSDNILITQHKHWVESGSPQNVIPVHNSAYMDYDNFHPEFNIFKFTDIPDKLVLSEIKQSAGAIILFELSNSLSVSMLENVLQFIDIPVFIKKDYKTASVEDLAIELSVDFGALLLQRKIQGLWIEDNNINSNKIAETVLNIFQASGLRSSKTEFISCPTCSRTSYDLESLLAKLQKEFSHLPGLKIAVMGCIVNGPGEMADADYGFIGTSKGKVNIYKGNSVIVKNSDIDSSISELKSLLKKDGKWIDAK